MNTLYDMSNQIEGISFGYRCSSASFLTKKGIRTCSMPFDWLVSRLSVIQHCIENQFQEFLTVSNYEKKFTKTFYHSNSTDNSQFICDEIVYVNNYYQPQTNPNPLNTYQYYLGINHRTITEPEDIEYYKRCISRLYECLRTSSPHKKIYLHIAPVMTKEHWNQNEQSIMEEAIEFNQFIMNQSVNPLYGVIFFLILGTTDETKILKMKDIENTKIYIMETNSRFVDGGECFMGENANEMLLINSILDDLISF
jgi:hypothetical protein